MSIAACLAIISRYFIKLVDLLLTAHLTTSKRERQRERERAYAGLDDDSSIISFRILNFDLENLNSNGACSCPLSSCSFRNNTRRTI